MPGFASSCSSLAGNDGPATGGDFGEIFMLILTRRVGETVVIGEDVSVTVLGVKGNQIRLGINAPKDVAVHRQEIFDRIQTENGDSDSGDKSGS